MSNSNYGKETAETKLMGNISDLKYAIAELKWNTDNVMVSEFEFLRAELTAKNKVTENLILSLSMLHDKLLCSHKSAPGNISAEGVCDNRSINYCYKSVNTNGASLGKRNFSENNLVNDCIDVDPILKDINDSLTRYDDVLERFNENADTNFNDMLHINVQCVFINRKWRK